MKLPTEEKMKEELDWLRKKIEKQYLKFAGHSNSWATIPLIDLLLKDMGVSNRRNKNYYEHWFGHLLPEDYLSVVTHRV